MCHRRIFCNSCYQNYVSGDILYDCGNVDKKENFGFSSSFFKKTSIIDDMSRKSVKDKEHPTVEYRLATVEEYDM